MKTKIFSLLISFSLLPAINLFSQVSREWVSIYSQSTDDAKALAVDKSGNIYVTGTSGGDYATVKYNSNGIQQWAARYNGSGNSTEYANSIAVDDSGNVYVTGGSTGTSSNLDYATVKYNSSGIQLWAVRYSSAGSNLDEAFSIAVDLSGSVYVTGGSYNSGTLNDYVTIKYNSSGVIQWARTYNGTGNNSDFAYRLALDVSGNVHVTGWSRGIGATDEDYATIKYNSSGDSLWVRRYCGRDLGYDQARSIAVDISGNVYVTGKSEGTGSSYDYATIKYNSSGDSLWVLRFNGIDNSLDAANSIAVDSSGNVYVSGQSYSSISNYDFVTIKYNSSGVSQWNKIYNGPGNSVENEYSMALDKSGNVYVTGSSALSGQNYNYATVKYNNAGIEQWSETYNGPLNGSDQSFSIASDISGKVYITGTSGGDFVTIKYSQNPYAFITVFIEGFYNSASDKMVSDTARVYLRNAVSPYAKVDSSVSKLDSTGKGRFYFSNINNGTNHYIVLKHRNSIETWSNGGNSFFSGSMTYDFSSDSNKAYGSNQIQIDASPVRFAIYSGDVNQDGIIDLSDGSLIDNNSFNFAVGYLNTDVNGDYAIDIADAAITENNAINFVSKIVP